jgi:NADH dehydrogenase (ubiquinone) Fe-S protein 1
LQHPHASRAFSATQIKRGEIELEIDGKSVKIEQGAALIQACDKAGVHIPRYCYHDKLQIAGNCRM